MIETMKTRPSTLTAASHLRRPRLAPVVAVAATLAVMAPSAARAASPWDLLEQLRDSLQRGGPVTGKFDQTYIPAGFEDGDRESGDLSIWLPDCLRWNYREPQAKSFLLCGDEVYFWNQDETGGRHYRIEPEQEPGLDLLLVEVERLKERYVAGNRKLADGTYEITLALPPDAERPFSASIRLEPVSMRVVGMEYTDEEGNLTRFEISDYQTLRHTALFTPPQGIEWTEE